MSKRWGEYRLSGWNAYLFGTDGFVIWGDNLQHLTKLRKQLDENKRKRENNKKKLKDAYLVQKELYELTEKNRIYCALR